MINHALSVPDAVLLWSLFWQFTVISLLAFGGGQSALPLIERVSVAQRGWLTTEAFTSGVGFGYMAPGPVTITATFIGYQAGGLLGALAATVGMFTAPTILAALAASGVKRLAQNRWLQAFGAGAAPAVVGLLGATAWNVARHSVTSWPLAVVALLALLLSARTKTQPIWVLLGGAALGWGIAAAR